MEDIIISDKTAVVIRNAMIPIGILILITIWRYRNTHFKESASACLKIGGALTLALVCQAFLFEYATLQLDLNAIYVISYIAMASTLMLVVKTGIITLCRDSRPNFGRVFTEASASLWISGWLLRDPLAFEDTLPQLATYVTFSTMILLFCFLVISFFIVIHKTMNWILSSMHPDHDENPHAELGKAISWLVVLMVLSLPMIADQGHLLSIYTFFMLRHLIDTYTFTIPMNLYLF